MQCAKVSFLYSNTSNVNGDLTFFTAFEMFSSGLPCLVLSV